jgi:predicted regulator of Ras-like GTPase activity (Roadblock/LC7/MglB family)
MTTKQASQAASNLNWLLSNFVNRVPGAVEAIVVSSDGLLMAMSENLSRAAADRFAAVASGLMGLAYGAAGPFEGGRVNEVIVEMDHAFLFVTSISDGSRMAVVTEAPCDVGLLGYEMAVFVERAGAVLTPGLVTELQALLPR